MDQILISKINKDIPATAFDEPSWEIAHEAKVDTYWSGEAAPETREFRVRALWSATAFYVRFEAEQHEPLIVSGIPNVEKKVHALWERDVCEIFIAPDKAAPNKYLEFEIAPTGEWLDLAIELTPEKRLTDREYSSGMEAAVRAETGKVTEIIKIPFRSLGKTPQPGDVWLGNLFRCVGAGETRGYLAWRPTHTKEPAFHVPAVFGEFRFLDQR
ncbi:MAG: carbohydrate-binding family 9-like protein [Pyrinomonadaceae bacterium]